MDYQTKPTSRRDLRRYAKYLRKIFDVPDAGAFPVLEALERLGDVFPNCNFVVVEENELPPQIMAQCTPNDQGGFTIAIRERVYLGAYENGIGAFRGFICHEICHVFLFFIGFTPIFARSFDNNVIPAYCSVEWQAKALCAEVMIPFEESSGMPLQKIIDYYQVSKAFASKRRRLDKGVPHKI